MTPEEYLEEHGINETSVEKFGLVWSKNKITIPVYDTEGNVLYNKYRHLGDEGGKYSFDKGSHNTIFNELALQDGDYVFITEGEMDCIRLDQEGISAVTQTSGAGSFKPEWSDKFKGKKIYIAYDNDEAGKVGAAKLMEIFPMAYNIELPEEVKDVCEFFKMYDKKAFIELVEIQKQRDTISYQELCAVFDKWLLLPDKNVIKVLLATLISHFFTTDPLWMFFVAPPSGSKTEIIQSVAHLPFVYLLSDLTAQTLASGLNAKVDPSLLLQLKNHVLVMKDFTTVLTMRHEDRQIILSQLREVYDGRYSKAFGTGKKIDWQGRLTLIAGVTPIIDTHTAIFQVMGERFIMYRIPQASKRLVAKKALSNYGKEKEMREELVSSVLKYFNSITIPDVNSIVLPEDILDALASLASFIVVARSAVIRDQMRREVEYIPTPEAPARLAKQLGTLIKALAVGEGRTTVAWSDYYLTLKTALDVIPANRTSHLVALCNEPGLISTTKVAQKTNFSTTGSSHILEDLTALEVFEVQRGGAGKPNEWQLAKETRELFKEILPFDTEEIYKVFTKNSPHLPIIKEMLRDVEVVDIQIPLEYQ